MTDPLNPGFTLPEDAPATPAAPPQAPAATPPMPGVVPTTIPAALRVAAQWLNGYDEWVRQVLVQAGADEDARAIAQGDEVQRFLESLAVWFDARPQLAELARGQVDL